MTAIDGPSLSQYPVDRFIPKWMEEWGVEYYSEQNQPNLQERQQNSLTHNTYQVPSEACEFTPEEKGIRIRNAQPDKPIPFNYSLLNSEESPLIEAIQELFDKNFRALKTVLIESNSIAVQNLAVQVDKIRTRLCIEVNSGAAFNNIKIDSQRSKVFIGEVDPFLFDSFFRTYDATAYIVSKLFIEEFFNAEQTTKLASLKLSLIDIITIMLKHYHSGAKTSDPDACWEIGEGLIKTGSRISERSTEEDEGYEWWALRSIKYPGRAFGAHPVFQRDPQVWHMDYFIPPDAEDVEGIDVPYVNSGIFNHAFYLAAHEQGGYLVNQVGQIWLAALEKIRNMQETIDKSFADNPLAAFAITTLQTAQEMEHLFGADINAILVRAWGKCGVDTRLWQARQYLFGLGGSHHIDKAVHLAQQIPQNSYALWIIGMGYEAYSKKEDAFKCYDLAYTINSHNVWATFKLAECYKERRGTPREFVKSKELFNACIPEIRTKAEGTDAIAQFFLSIAYQHGYGNCPQDEIEAKKWKQIAIQIGRLQIPVVPIELRLTLRAQLQKLQELSQQILVTYVKLRTQLHTQERERLSNQLHKQRVKERKEIEIYCS